MNRVVVPLILSSIISGVASVGSGSNLGVSGKVESLAAGIPMAGLVMMTIVLNAVNLPLEGIGLILAVDRILDMSRSTVNVWGDTCAAVIIARLEGEELKI